MPGVENGRKDIVDATPLFSETTLVIPGRSSKESSAPVEGASSPDVCPEGYSRSAVAAWLRSNEMEKAGSKLENCRKRGMVLCCLNGHRWGVRIRCDLRVCPECLKRLGKKVWDVRARDMDAMRRGRSGWTWKLLTLTVKTGEVGWDKDELKARIVKVWKCGRSLLKEFFLNRDGAGAVGVTEVGKGGNVHVHLVVWGPYVPQETLAARWEQLTKDSKVVDVRKVKGSLRGALAYVGKYLSKVPGFLLASHFGIYLQAITGHRRIHTFGCLLRVSDPELKPGCICRDCGLALRLDETFLDRWRYPPWEWILAGIDGVAPLTRSLEDI